MSSERERIEAAIEGLEAQRALLGDAVAEPALRLLRARLAAIPGAQTAVSGARKLRQVTILFLDVVGSTTLTQRLDPEDVHGALEGVLNRCTAIVELHGGKVLEYAGDSLLAVFGAEAAQEDDPERAIRAGLALLAEASLLRAELRREHGRVDFDLRIGVHSGDVVLASGANAKSSMRGSAVNIAARMEQTAPAGGLRISHDTYRHVRGIFDVEPQAPIEVKGLDQRVVTYLVRRTKARAFRTATRGIEGVETRMIGRVDQLRQLQDAFLRLCSQGGFATAFIVAEAGLGKSRLLYEFANWSETRSEVFYIFQGRASPQTRSQPYGLLRDVLAWWLQIADGDSMQTAKLKIEQGISPLFEADDGEDMAQAHAHVLGHLIGLDFADSRHVKGIQDDGKQIRNRGFHAAAQTLRRVAAQHGAPVVLQLDDLHWADDGSLDFLVYLGRVNRDVPMLVLGLTRPTLFERRTDDFFANAGRVALGPLDRESSHLLADELLKKLPEIPVALRELIIGGAEGNPFYMEELVKMLVDEGAIETGDASWTVRADKLLSSRIPQTLTGVLQARLDSLRPAERLALQQASVIGFVFWDQALAALDCHAPAALPALEQRELIAVRPDAGLEGVREYAFGHHILHRVTYDTLLKPTRRELHRAVADWLARLSGARANDFLGATAEHFSQAGDNALACEYFARAAEDAARRYSHDAAMTYVAQALARLEDPERLDSLPLRWRLLDVRERVLQMQGKRGEQRAEIEALGKLADAMGDDGRRAEVAWRRSNIAGRMGDFRTSESAAREALALAQRAGDVALGLRAQQRLAIALCMLGDIEAGKSLASSGLATARGHGLRYIEPRFLNALCFIAATQDDLGANLELTQQELSIQREIGNAESETSTLTNLGNAWVLLGEHTQAKRCFEESLRLMHTVGNRQSEPFTLVGLSHLAMQEEDAALAAAHAQSALDVALRMQSARAEESALCALGNAHLALKLLPIAAGEFERAQVLQATMGTPLAPDATAGRARVLAEQGHVEEALRMIEGLLSHLDSGGKLEGTVSPRLVRLRCHEVLACADDPRAPEVLATAHRELQARASTLAEPTLRNGFLCNIPAHRDIAAAWDAACAAAGASVQSSGS